MPTIAVDTTVRRDEAHHVPEVGRVDCVRVHLVGTSALRAEISEGLQVVVVTAVATQR